MPPCYEIRLRDRPGVRSADSFLGLDVRTGRGILLLRAELDQSALHGLLERIRVLHVDLLDVRRVRGMADKEGP